MEIRRELLKDKGEIDFFTWRDRKEAYCLSLRGTDDENVYELYKRIVTRRRLEITVGGLAEKLLAENPDLTEIIENKDEVIVKGSLEDCVAKGNKIAREVYPDWEDDTIAEDIEVKMGRIRRKHQSKGEDKNDYGSYKRD